MYASLIGAGVTQLFDLFRSQTQSTSQTQKDSTDFTSVDNTKAASASTTIGTGTSGGLSTDLNKLLLDLQSSSNTSSTTAADLQSAFGSLHKAGTANGHRHGPADQPADNTVAAGTTASNPFQNLSASLLAYAKSQGVAATSSTGLALTA